jgi:hypothetical protein
MIVAALGSALPFVALRPAYASVSCSSGSTTPTLTITFEKQIGPTNTGYAGNITTNASTFCTSTVGFVQVTATTQGSTAPGPYTTIHATTSALFGVTSVSTTDTAPCQQGPWNWRGDGTGGWADQPGDSMHTTGDNYSSGYIATDCISPKESIGP